MKKLLLMVASFLMSYSSHVQAQFVENCQCIGNDFYVEILGGANFIQALSHDGVKANYRFGYIASASIGYIFCYGLRTEFEYSYRRNPINQIEVGDIDFSAHGHFESSSFMFNFLVDLPLYAWWTCMWGIQPYFGGGIGTDYQKEVANGSGVFLKEKSNHFSWQAIIGFSYPIFRNTDISIQYKYHKGGFSWLGCHTAGVGLKYVFDLY